MPRHGSHFVNPGDKQASPVFPAPEAERLPVGFRGPGKGAEQQALAAHEQHRFLHRHIALSFLF